MLSEQEKSQIRQLLSSPQWQTIQRMAEIYIQHIKENSPVRDTLDGTAIEAVLQDGKIRGVRELFKQLMDEVQ